MKAYKFLRDDMKSGEGTEPAWKEGEERTYEGQIELCRSGYHSSPSIYAALQYAQGCIACVVEVSKPVEKQTDKQVSRTLKIVVARNAGKVLRAFACDCAERALKEALVTDERCWNAIKVSRLYNEGKATKEELGAARAAARDAAWDAARDAGAAAWAAAWDAAWDAGAAAWAAAWAAARDARAAAWAAARDAAWDAGDAAVGWQKRHLNNLFRGMFNVRKEVKVLQCKKCHSKHINKDGTRRIRADGVIKRVQAFVCFDCFHQWIDKTDIKEVRE